MKFLSILLFSILFSFPVLALDICHLSKNNQWAVTEGLALSISSDGQREESGKVTKSFKEKGCSAIKPYKMSQLTELSYSEDLDDYSISKANDLFKQFPTIELITIKVLTQKIPENLFHGLPNLKKVVIFGVIEKLPTRLFEQNSNLEEFIIRSDEFIGFSGSQFFRYIPGLEELTVHTLFLSNLKLPEDFCDAVPSLRSFKGGRSVNKVPRSCQNYAWFSSL